MQVEWILGKNQSFFKDKDNKYLIPVVIDDVELYGEKISKHFDTNINISAVPQGNPSEKFLNDIKHLLNIG